MHTTRALQLVPESERQQLQWLHHTNLFPEVQQWTPHKRVDCFAQVDLTRQLLYEYAANSPEPPNWPELYATIDRTQTELGRLHPRLQLATCNQFMDALLCGHYETEALHHV